MNIFIFSAHLLSLSLSFFLILPLLLLSPFLFLSHHFIAKNIYIYLAHPHSRNYTFSSLLLPPLSLLLTQACTSQAAITQLLMDVCLFAVSSLTFSLSLSLSLNVRLVSVSLPLFSLSIYFSLSGHHNVSSNISLSFSLPFFLPLLRRQSKVTALYLRTKNKLILICSHSLTLYSLSVLFNIL